MSHPLIDHLAEKVFSVGEYLDLVNELLAPLRVSVEGEVSELKELSQWTFFALKDDATQALLSCGLHAGAYRRLGVALAEGMRVRVEGYGKVQAKSGRFGFWVSRIEPIGEGALRRAYELLRTRLAEDGLFVRKRALPPCIAHLGVISSRNGVVLQDLRANLRPLGIHIDFLHSGVEGADSASELLRAIEHFSHTVDRPEVLVLIRGGGSLESLQGFNNEAVCRALSAAPMPVLVGIGHDVDAPLATLVADWSASTPTAVAHVINASWAPLTERMPMHVERIAARFAHRTRTVLVSVPLRAQTLRAQFLRRVRTLEHEIDRAGYVAEHAITQVVSRFVHYEHVLGYAALRIPALIREAERAGFTSLFTVYERFRAGLRALEANMVLHERAIVSRDPVRVLARGYALVYHTTGVLVRSVREVPTGAILSTQLTDGTVESTVVATHEQQ